jgi:hypothetical protein
MTLQLTQQLRLAYMRQQLTPTHHTIVTAPNPPAVDDKVRHPTNCSILPQLLLHQLLPLAGGVVQHSCSISTGQACCLNRRQQEVLIVDVLLLQAHRTTGRQDKRY